jgi:hypothetical protein
MSFRCNQLPLVAFVLLLLICQAHAQDEAKEPPLTFVVKLDEQEARIVEGETGKLPGFFTNPQLTITPEPYRVFPFQGVRFEYPRTYSFASNLKNPREKTWTLSGDDATIMFFAFPHRVTAAQYAEGTVKLFAKTEPKIVETDCKLKLGAIEVTGIKIQTNYAHTLTQEAFDLPTPKGRSRLLILQDNPDKEGNRSPEMIGIRKLLDKSFQIMDAK